MKQYKNNTLTIIGKECKRFFSDRSLVFTSIIMPGLLIYLIYTLMGDAMNKKMQADPNDVTVMQIENMPASIYPSIQELPLMIKEGTFDHDATINQIADKENNLIYVVFPPAFDSLIATYNVASGLPAPNVRIYYNSACTEAEATYTALCAALDAFESSKVNIFDINAQQDPNNPEIFNQITEEDFLGDLFSGIIPMLILMLLFSGCMAIAPTSIAGEKERGTIATLLVTPLKRHELALGKIIALSCFALLSGISSFVGIMLSLPKMIPTDELNLNANLYTTSDYLCLLFAILSTTLVLVSLIAIISAYAKDVKNAGTMVTPLMLVIMFIGLTPMFGDGAPTQLAYYLIPVYNSIQYMASVFNHVNMINAMIVTVASNVVYTILGVVLLSKMFDNEKVMFRN